MLPCSGPSKSVEEIAGFGDDEKAEDRLDVLDGGGLVT
jgi:hypothetical protein